MLSIEANPLKPESQAVLDALALYSASQLENFYKVSAEKAAEEFQNIQALKRQTAQHYPALKLFDGLMYRHIKRDKLIEDVYKRQVFGSCFQLLYFKEKMEFGTVGDNNPISLGFSLSRTEGI